MDQLQDYSIRVSNDNLPVKTTITAAKYYLMSISFHDHSESPNTFQVELDEDLNKAAQGLWSFLSGLTEEARTGVLVAWLQSLERQLQASIK